MTQPPVYFDYLNRFDIEDLALTDAEILAAIEDSLAMQGRGDTEIELTRREFELLAHLLHARGRAVTKRELLSAVWGDDEADPAVVGVYVGYLRRKVDEPFGAHAIETVRGVGYRLATSGGTSPEHRSP